MKGDQKAFSTVAACAVVVVLLFSTSTTVRAQVTNLAPGQKVNLGTVISGGWGVQVGDKLFQNFSFSYSDNNTSNIDLTSANVNLTALSNAIGFGVEFTEPMLALGTDWKDVGLKYTATVTDPDYSISDIHLAITGAAGHGGLGTVNDDVFVGGFGGTNVGNLYASIPGSSTADANIVPSVVELWVQKDVKVDGGGAANGSSTISIVDQTYSQIPEPSTALLVGLGLLGAVAVMRNRKS